MAHFLKRLELNGFKSFAGKTVLEFPAGITAIVGPNGSGKSNVVDAIRWLLGERDAKNLRGAKVEDLIFAGTPKRARVGQAQASLHFENHNHFFPVDFEEVSVMRQVNRDGTSKYFLNGSEILLRDLVDFYAKARLGARGLVVVTQGNSDLFIEATSTGRREMIEELLGLREYQIKKSDAEKRLKNSQTNLEQVSALIEEILPHLRSLKRQTGRWEKRDQFAQELRDLENQFFGSQASILQKELSTLQKETGVHGQILPALTKKRQEAQDEQKEVEASEPLERQELKKVKDEIRALFGTRSQLQKDIGKLEAQLEAYEQTYEAASASASELLGLLRKVKAELRSLVDSQTADWKKTIDDILEEISVGLGEVKVPSQKSPAASVFEQELEKINGQLKKLDDQLTSLKTREAQLEKSQEVFYNVFKQAISAVTQAKDEIEAWEKQNSKMSFEKERLQLRLEDLKRQVEQAGRSWGDFEHWNAEGPLEHAPDAERRIFKLRGDLASIGEVDEALVKEAKETEERYHFLKVQAEDLEKAQKDLRQLIRDLRDKIKVEFEHALKKLNKEFENFFQLMFGGGQARLILEKPAAKPKAKDVSDDDLSEGKEPAEKQKEEEDDLEEGVDIEVKLPKKRLSSLDVLSGGERSLVGLAALFALISVSPPPFLVLDEIDAALDERNSRRFSQMLQEFSKHTQFVVVTHNRATMEAANVLYGVTLEEDGSSKILSLKLES